MSTLPACTYWMYDLYCFDPEFAVEAALPWAAVPVLFLLLPTAALYVVVRHYLSLKEFGTAHLTRERAEALRTRSPVLRALARATMALTLLLGGLVIQLGYMAPLFERY